jgi:transcriptional regulator with XRE-family HTH domain
MLPNNEMFELLNKIAVNEQSPWLEKAKFRSENRAWLKLSSTIAVSMLFAMDELNLSQKDLADRMGISAQQVNKWVKGKENFTLETITRIESALNIKLIEVPKENEPEVTKFFYVRQTSIIESNNNPLINQHSTFFDGITPSQFITFKSINEPQKEDYIPVSNIEAVMAA